MYTTLNQYKFFSTNVPSFPHTLPTACLWGKYLLQLHSLSTSILPVSGRDNLLISDSFSHSLPIFSFLTLIYLHYVNGNMQIGHLGKTLSQVLWDLFRTEMGIRLWKAVSGFGVFVIWPFFYGGFFFLYWQLKAFIPSGFMHSLE